MTWSVTQKRRQEIQCGHLWRRPANLGKLVVNTVTTMVENLKWKSESGEREVRETPVEVGEKEKGKSVLLKSEAKMKRKGSTWIASVDR